jgi:hypothetical protein
MDPFLYAGIAAALALPMLLIGRSGVFAAAGAGILLIELLILIPLTKCALRHLRLTELPEWLHGLPVLGLWITVYAAMNLLFYFAILPPLARFFSPE